MWLWGTISIQKWHSEISVKDPCWENEQFSPYLKYLEIFTGLIIWRIIKETWFTWNFFINQILRSNVSFSMGETDTASYKIRLGMMMGYHNRTKITKKKMTLGHFTPIDGPKKSSQIFINWYNIGLIFWKFFMMIRKKWSISIFQKKKKKKIKIWRF